MEVLRELFNKALIGFLDNPMKQEAVCDVKMDPTGAQRDTSAKITVTDYIVRAADRAACVPHCFSDPVPHCFADLAPPVRSATLPQRSRSQTTVLQAVLHAQHNACMSHCFTPQLGALLLLSFFY